MLEIFWIFQGGGGQIEKKTDILDMGVGEGEVFSAQYAIKI